MGWIVGAVLFAGLVVLPWLVSRRYRDDPLAIGRMKREEYQSLVRHIWHH